MTVIPKCAVVRERLSTRQRVRGLAIAPPRQLRLEYPGRLQPCRMMSAPPFRPAESITMQMIPPPMCPSHRSNDGRLPKPRRGESNPRNFARRWGMPSTWEASRNTPRRLNETSQYRSSRASQTLQRGGSQQRSGNTIGEPPRCTGTTGRNHRNRLG